MLPCLHDRAVVGLFYYMGVILKILLLCKVRIFAPPLWTANCHNSFWGGLFSFFLSLLSPGAGQVSLLSSSSSVMFYYFCPGPNMPLEMLFYCNCTINVGFCYKTYGNIFSWCIISKSIASGCSFVYILMHLLCNPLCMTRNTWLYLPYTTVLITLIVCGLRPLSKLVWYLCALRNTIRGTV